MRTVSYLIAAGLGFFGLVFLIGSQGVILRLVVGIILLVGAGVMVYLARMQPQITRTETTVVQKIDLSGDVELEKMMCDNCGAPLSQNSVEVRAGAIFVDCEHCSATYQIEEAPKW